MAFWFRNRLYCLSQHDNSRQTHFCWCAVNRSSRQTNYWPGLCWNITLAFALNLLIVRHKGKPSDSPTHVSSSLYFYLDRQLIHASPDQALKREASREREDNPYRASGPRRSMKFSIVCAILQLLLVILFAVLTDYGDNAIPYHKRVGKGPNATAKAAEPTVNGVQVYYGSKYTLSILPPLWRAIVCLFVFQILARLVRFLPFQARQI